MKVCQKVEGKGRTTYNEVADELVHEFSAPGPQGAHPGRTSDPCLIFRTPDRLVQELLRSGRRVSSPTSSDF